MYEKGQAPVVADSRPPADTTTDSGGGSASVTGAPPTSVAGAPLASVRPVRPSPNRPSQPPPVAKMADVQVSGSWDISRKVLFGIYIISLSVHYFMILGPLVFRDQCLLSLIASWH